MSEFQENSIVRLVERLTDTIYRLTLFAPRLSNAAEPGQFVMAACGPSLDPLLRRPFSIHDVNQDNGCLQLLFKVVGQGTRLLSTLQVGDSVSLLGPLGQGFKRMPKGPVCLVGGGMGIAPLLYLAKRLTEQSALKSTCAVLLGARTRTDLHFLEPAFRALGCSTYLATDDGSLGHHGLVSDLLPAALSGMRKVYVCGPLQMMATVARLCQAAQVPCEVSLETHMACGLGACLGCAIPAGPNQYKHVCKHGPVFAAEEVVWNR